MPALLHFNSNQLKIYTVRDILFQYYSRMAANSQADGSSLSVSIEVHFY